MLENILNDDNLLACWDAQLEIYWQIIFQVLEFFVLELDHQDFFQMISFYPKHVVKGIRRFIILNEFKGFDCLISKRFH